MYSGRIDVRQCSVKIENFMFVLFKYPFKPPIKEPTEPLDLILHTDLRAIDRAEFYLQVNPKCWLGTSVLKLPGKVHQDGMLYLLRM